MKEEMLEGSFISRLRGIGKCHQTFQYAVEDDEL